MWVGEGSIPNAVVHLLKTHGTRSNSRISFETAFREGRNLDFSWMVKATFDILKNLRL